MIVKNPTKDRIEVRIQGVDYVVEGNGEVKGVPVQHAEYWVSMLHTFLSVEEEKDDADITLKSHKTDEEEEVKEPEEETEEVLGSEATTEEVVEAPKTRGRKPKNK